jgi:hypothetical protein
LFSKLYEKRENQDGLGQNFLYDENRKTLVSGGRLLVQYEHE